jgi:hypothetical protein
MTTDSTFTDATVPYLTSRDPQVAEDFGKRRENISEDHVGKMDWLGRRREEYPLESSFCQRS